MINEPRRGCIEMQEGRGKKATERELEKICEPQRVRGNSSTVPRLRAAAEEPKKRGVKVGDRHGDRTGSPKHSR